MDEEEYDNDAYYTEGFVKKRQLNMNVAHYTTLSDEDCDGDGSAYGSVGSSDICKDSSDEAETKSTGSSVDSSHPVIHSAYMMNASGENGDRSDSEDSSDDDAQDDASVESYKYSTDKLMMCEKCDVRTNTKSVVSPVL